MYAVEVLNLNKKFTYKKKIIKKNGKKSLFKSEKITKKQYKSTIFSLYAYSKLRSDTMAYKEIVTKAVIGKGKKKYKNSQRLMSCVIANFFCIMSQKQEIICL